MLLNHRLLLVVMVVTVLSGAWLAAEEEVTITLDQAPKVVKESILKAAGEAKGITVERETTRQGTVVYEASWMEADGKTAVEVVVAADGTVLKTEREAVGLPDVVMQVLAKKAGAGNAVTIGAGTVNDKVVYAAGWKEVDGEVQVQMLISDDGKVLSTE